MLYCFNETFHMPRTVQFTTEQVQINENGVRLRIAIPRCSSPPLNLPESEKFLATL